MDTPDQLEFSYEIAVDDSQVDIFDLGPALSALGTLIQQAHKTLYPRDPELRIEVRPFRAGSLGIDTIVQVATESAPLVAVAAMPVMPHVVEALKHLGIIAGATDNVLKLMERLKGKPQVASAGAGTHRYTAGAESVVVNGPVHQLFQNSVIVKSLDDAYAKPIRDPRVTQVRSYAKRERDRTLVVVDRDEAGAIRRCAEGFEGSQTDVPEPSETTTTVFLNPRRGSFEGDGSRWSFRKGGQTITATIKDKGFLRQVREGSIRLTHTDLLRVRLRERQKVVGTTVKPSSYEILEVLDYQPGEHQGDLPETA